MTANTLWHYIRKLTPYNIVKGVRYLRHFGWKEFWVRFSERMEPEEVPYSPWYENYVPTDEELQHQRKYRWSIQDVISILVPVYHTPEKYLRDMIGSVLAQTCPRWELCLVNAGPDDETVSRILREYKAKDNRIRIKTLDRNAGIAGNTNEALSMARGSWIGLLDHDDMLSPCAIFQIMRFLEKHPDSDMIYTDEDKISADGTEHFQPHLKPDYSPDLLRSNNYICHFLAVRRKTALDAGGFREEFDGAQDYDFIFRCAEKARRIGHVPEILYHWRTHASSTSDNPMSKMYAYEAGKRAIEEHLARMHVPGIVRLKKDLGFYRVMYPVQGDPLVSVLIPNKDEKETLEKCLTSVREKSTWKNVEIIVIENNSEDPATFEYYKEIDGKDSVRVIRWEGPFNYSAINNFGARHARGDYLLFLNNDIEVISPGWIEEMLGTCQREDVGAVGARLYYPDDTIQHAGIVLGIGGIAGSMFVGMSRGRGGYLHKAELMQDLSAVTAACMMMDRTVFDAAGGFEEKLSVAFNDVDLCLRVNRLGCYVVYDPYAELYHYESKTRGAEDTKGKVRRFQNEIEFMRTRWEKQLIQGDPFYNKNLSVAKWNYSLRLGARMQ